MLLFSWYFHSIMHNNKWRVMLRNRQWLLLCFYPTLHIATNIKIIVFISKIWFYYPQFLKIPTENKEKTEIKRKKEAKGCTQIICKIDVIHNNTFQHRLHNKHHRRNRCVSSFHKIYTNFPEFYIVSGLDMNRIVQFCFRWSIYRNCCEW